MVRDGMMQGINRDATERVVRAVPVPVFASGGLRDLEDLAALKHCLRASWRGYCRARPLRGTAGLKRRSAAVRQPGLG